MVVVKAVGVVFGFVLMSSAAIVAGIGLWICIRHSDDHRGHRFFTTVLSLAAVILGNAWFLWVFLFFPHRSYNYETYEHLCKIGMRVPLLSSALGLLGTTAGRIFAIVSSLVLFLLWISIGA
jgi:hypothetical protein